MAKMSKKERIQAALKGEETDRVPISLWTHFPDVDQDPRWLAETQVAFLEKYDLDFIKLMPFGLYCVQDWGCKILLNGKPRNTPFPDEFAIQKSEDWQSIQEFPATYGTWCKQVQLAHHIKKLNKSDVPFIQTIYSPLNTALKLAGDRLYSDMKQSPELVHEALHQITNTTINFIEANIEAGVSGFFFATQCATRDIMNRETFEEFGKRYDLQLFDRFKDETYFNVLHIHGNNIMFDELLSYPANCISWHDRWTEPSITQAKKLTDKCLLCGIAAGPERGKRDVLQEGDPEEIREHIVNAVESADRRGIIIGPGCIAKYDTPERNYYAARLAVEFC